MLTGMSDLTDKQQRFVYAYISCWNATKAAREAGYKATNGSLAVIGHENLRKPKIKAAIEAEMNEFAMPRQEVLARLALQARGDIGDFASIENSADLANHPQSYLVKKFKKKVYYNKDGEPYEEIELELYDNHAPLVDIGRVHSMFTDKVEHSGSIENRLITLPEKDVQ